MQRYIAPFRDPVPEDLKAVIPMGLWPFPGLLRMKSWHHAVFVVALFSVRLGCIP